MTNRIVDFFRDSKTGLGIPNRTVSVRQVVGDAEIATAQTDANGKFVFTVDDIGWVGPIYYLVDDGSGTYKRHSGQSFGQVGAVWFDALLKALGGLGKGVMSGLAVTADGGGMDVAVGTGLAIAADGIPYFSEASQEVVIAASDPANPRIDLIVLRVKRAGQTDEGTCSLVAITGTPGSSPVAPARTANSTTDDLVLAEVLVDAGASVIASGKVTDRRFIAGQEVLSVPLNGAVLSGGTVDTAQLADDAVTTAKIDDDAVDTAQIADGAVTSDQIEDDAVTTAKIDDDAVTTAKIAAGAVTADEIGVSAVTNIKVSAGIDAVKIGGGAVSNTEFGYLDGVTSAIQPQLDAKSAASHVHTMTATLYGKATNAYSSVVSIDSTGTDDICNFNLGPLVSGVTYDVIAQGSAQANAPSGQTITLYVRIEAGGTPAAGYGTATVGGERQLEAFDGKAVVGSGSSINISLRAATTGGSGSINGALVWAMAIPRNVPAS